MSKNPLANYQNRDSFSFTLCDYFSGAHSFCYSEGFTAITLCILVIIVHFLGRFDINVILLANTMYFSF